MSQLDRSKTLEEYLFREGYSKVDIEHFRTFHRNNSWVWDAFKERALKAVRNKKKKIAAKMIIENIRWHEEIEAKKGREFKINNNYTSMYARTFVFRFPQYKDLFEFRKASGLNL